MRTIKGLMWVSRDRDGKLFLHTEFPKADMQRGWYNSNGCLYLKEEPPGYKDVSFDGGPVPVGLQRHPLYTA
jgi:hypothetical protein